MLPLFFPTFRSHTSAIHPSWPHNSEVELDRWSIRQLRKVIIGHIIQLSSSYCFSLKYVSDIVIHYCLNHLSWRSWMYHIIKRGRAACKKDWYWVFFQCLVEFTSEDMWSRLLFVGRLLIMDSISLLVIHLFRLFVS